MLLSILIPTYNNSDVIYKCVQSALNQNYYDNYEVIVANNASTDDTGLILSSISDSRLKIINNPKTVSLSANHNILLREAQSDYVLFLHSDDELLPDALKILEHRIKERLYPQRYILYGHSMYGDVSEWTNGQCQMLGYNTMFSGITAKRIMLTAAAPQPTGTCYSRKSILQLGGFVDSDNYIMQDWLLAEQAAYNYFEFEMMDRIILKREYSSTDSKLTGKQRSEAILLTHQLFWDSLTKMQQEDLKSLWKMYNIRIWDVFFYRMLTREEKLVAYRRKIKSNPFNVKAWIIFFRVYFTGS